MAARLTLGVTDRSPSVQKAFEHSANLMGHLLPRAVWSPGLSRNVVNSLWAVENLRKAGVSAPNSVAVPFRVNLPQPEFNLQAIAEKYDCFLIDLSGVVFNSSGVLPWAGDTLNTLQVMGKTIFFLSNTADRSPNYLIKKIEKTGFTPSPESVIPSGKALSMVLKRGESIFLVGDDYENYACSPYITSTGARLFDPARESGPPDRIVICFFHPDKNLPQLQTAIRLAKKMPLEPLADDGIILANPDRSFPNADGSLAFGTGLAADYLNEAGLPFTVVGKPAPLIYRYALKELARQRIHFPKKRILMVGDSVDYDILGATNFGIDSLLVLSGNHQNSDLDEFCRLFTEVATPNYVLRRFSFD